MPDVTSYFRQIGYRLQNGIFFTSDNTKSAYKFKSTPNCIGPLANRSTSSASHSSTVPLGEISPNMLLPPRLKNDKRKRGRVSASEVRNRAKIRKKKDKRQKKGKENINSKQYMSFLCYGSVVRMYYAQSSVCMHKYQGHLMPDAIDFHTQLDVVITPPPPSSSSSITQSPLMWYRYHSCLISQK
jgi:hypothetical protein